MSSADLVWPVGVVFDTRSRGQFDLVLYADGVLGIPSTYRDYKVRMVRLDLVLSHNRAEVVAEQPVNFFIPRDSLQAVTLRKRWCRHTLILHTQDKRRKFSWWPPLNNFNRVSRFSGEAFGDLLTVDGGVFRRPRHAARAAAA